MIWILIKYATLGLVVVAFLIHYHCYLSDTPLPSGEKTDPMEVLYSLTFMVFIIIILIY
jgi:hypothetical protein